MNALDALYLELVPCRPSPVDASRYADGPTARWMASEREKEKWLAVAAISPSRSGVVVEGAA